MPERRETRIEDGQVVSEIEGYYEVVTKDNEGEAHIHRLKKHSTKMRPAPEEIEKLFVSQATPNRIRPTKRVRPDDTIDAHVFYGDTHHPFQDERKLELAQIAVRELMPKTVTFLGDDTDMALFSTFESRQEWLDSTQAGIDQFSERLGKVRADVGREATINALQGNHDYRGERELRKYNAELLGLKRANADDELGVLTHEFLLRADEMDVNYYDGYPRQELWITDEFKVYHGRRTSSNGLVASKEIMDEVVNFGHGHTHQAGIVWRTLQLARDEEKTIFGFEGGTFAGNDVPSGQFSRTSRGEPLHQAHNWQTVLTVVRETPEGLVPEQIPIGDEGILLEGKWYKS